MQVRNPYMKKIICALLALTMMLLCAGCGENETGGTAPSGIYYDITGIAPDETLMEVDGNPISAELYFYWTAYNCSSIDYQLLTAYNYYGSYSDLVSEDGTSLVWSGELADGNTLSEFAREQSEDTIKFYSTIETMAKEYDISLTDEDKAAIEDSHAAAVEDLGSEEAFEKYLYQLGLTQDAFDRISSVAYLFAGLTDLVLEEGSPLYLAEEDYNEYGIYADHILLATIDPTTGTAIPSDQIAAKLETVNDLLKQLRASDDPETLFAQLADEYSEDTGRETNPTGYIYTPGTMVEIFEDTAAALEPGEISDIIQSDYGYHIILRKDLLEGLKEYPEQKRALAEQHLQSLIELEMADVEVTYSEKLDDFDAGTFYSDYLDRMGQLAPDETVEGEDSSVGDTAGNTTGTNGTADNTGSTNSNGANSASGNDANGDTGDNSGENG